jgi:hypothetical protein
MPRLSKAARNLLRRRANRESVDVTPDNLQAYRELAKAGVMEPLSGFMRGPEAVFHFTEEGWNRREELQRSPVADELPTHIQGIEPIKHRIVTDFKNTNMSKKFEIINI